MNKFDRWNRVLLEEEGEGGGSGGAGGDGGDPPKDPPQSIPLDALPEDLRGLKPEQLRRTLDAMASALSTRNADVRTLRERLDQLEKGKKEPEPPKKPSLPEGKTLKDLMMDDPDAAAAHIRETTIAEIEERFGDRFSRVEAGVSQSTLRGLKSEYDDWDEHQDAVMSVIKENGIERPTSGDLESAYLMVVGHKALEAKRAASTKKAQLVEKPTPAGDGGEKRKRELTPLQNEIAAGMGFVNENGEVDVEEYGKWLDAEDLTLEVPTGA